MPAVCSGVGKKDIPGWVGRILQMDNVASWIGHGSVQNTAVVLLLHLYTDMNGLLKQFLRCQELGASAVAVSMA